ncbi:barstar family protein [Sessilibacter sp. MAH3]
MQVTIDRGKVHTEEDFYNTFLPQVSAPKWHGRNLDALADSVITGDVNQIEPPYTIYNINTGNVAESVSEFQLKVLGIFNEAVASRRLIKIVTE